MIEYLGFLAESCILVQASVRSILEIRAAAHRSNILFVFYVYREELPPAMAPNSVLITTCG